MNAFQKALKLDQWGSSEYEGDDGPHNTPDAESSVKSSELGCTTSTDPCAAPELHCDQEVNASTKLPTAKSSESNHTATKLATLRLPLNARTAAAVTKTTGHAKTTKKESRIYRKTNRKSHSAKSQTPGCSPSTSVAPPTAVLPSTTLQPPVAIDEVPDIPDSWESIASDSSGSASPISQQRVEKEETNTFDEVGTVHLDPAKLTASLSLCQKVVPKSKPDLATSSQCKMPPAASEYQICDNPVEEKLKAPHSDSLTIYSSPRTSSPLQPISEDSVHQSAKYASKHAAKDSGEVEHHEDSDPSQVHSSDKNPIPSPNPADQMSPSFEDVSEIHSEETCSTCIKQESPITQDLDTGNTENIANQETTNDENLVEEQQLKILNDSRTKLQLPIECVPNTEILKAIPLKCEASPDSEDPAALVNKSSTSDSLDIPSTCQAAESETTESVAPMPESDSQNSVLTEDSVLQTKSESPQRSCKGAMDEQGRPGISFHESPSTETISCNVGEKLNNEQSLFTDKNIIEDRQILVELSSEAEDVCETVADNGEYMEIEVNDIIENADTAQGLGQFHQLSTGGKFECEKISGVQQENPISSSVFQSQEPRKSCQGIQDKEEDNFSPNVLSTPQVNPIPEYVFIPGCDNSVELSSDKGSRNESAISDSNLTPHDTIHNVIKTPENMDKITKEEIGHVSDSSEGTKISDCHVNEDCEKMIGTNSTNNNTDSEKVDIKDTSQKLMAIRDEDYSEKTEKSEHCYIKCESGLSLNIPCVVSSTTNLVSSGSDSTTDQDYISDDDNLAWGDPECSSSFLGGDNDSSSNSDTDEFFSMDSDSDEDDSEHTCSVKPRKGIQTTSGQVGSSYSSPQQETSDYLQPSAPSGSNAQKFDSISAINTSKHDRSSTSVTAENCCVTRTPVTTACDSNISLTLPQPGNIILHSSPLDQGDIQPNAKGVSILPSANISDGPSGVADLCRDVQDSKSIDDQTDHETSLGQITRTKTRNTTGAVHNRVYFSNQIIYGKHREPNLDVGLSDVSEVEEGCSGTVGGPGGMDFVALKTQLSAQGTEVYKDKPKFDRDRARSTKPKDIYLRHTSLKTGHTGISPSENIYQQGSHSFESVQPMVLPVETTGQSGASSPVLESDSESLVPRSDSECGYGTDTSTDTTEEKSPIRVSVNVADLSFPTSRTGDDTEFVEPGFTETPHFNKVKGPGIVKSKGCVGSSVSKIQGATGTLNQTRSTKKQSSNESRSVSWAHGSLKGASRSQGSLRAQGSSRSPRLHLSFKEQGASRTPGSSGTQSALKGHKGNFKSDGSVRTKCTVVITDTDANTTNTLRLDSTSSEDPTFEEAGRRHDKKRNIVSCAGVLDDDRQPESHQTDHEVKPNLSYDYNNPEFTMSPYATCSDRTMMVYTDSTVGGIDTLSYSDSSIVTGGGYTLPGIYEAVGYASDNDSTLQYLSPDTSDLESGVHYVSTESGLQYLKTDTGDSDMQYITPDIQDNPIPPTCPHGYPMLLHGAPCGPDSALLAGVYNSLAPLHCTLPPDCSLPEECLLPTNASTPTSPKGTSTAAPSLNADVSMDSTSESYDQNYSTSSSPLECSGYSYDSVTADSHIPLATIPNTTATIPALIGNPIMASEHNTPASPSTSLQFRVQLKEFAFVGSCLKIAAKVSLTEEDADFWKHMHPGDVYFFSANSYVLCVQRSKQTKVTSTKTVGLNPNANVFHIKSPTTPPASDTAPPGDAGSSSSEWSPVSVETINTPTAVDGITMVPMVDALNNVIPDTGQGYTLMNGDVSMKSPPDVTMTTVFPPTPESPMSVGGSEYSSVNGTLDTHVLGTLDTPIHSTMDGQVLFASNDPSQPPHDENNPLDGNIPDDELRSLLKTQLEYYFSRENLANDSYLVSQMDADQYVSTSTIANFNQVKRLTNDLDLVISVLRESAHVQVDDPGQKVRPVHKRCIVILREIPDTTPVEAVQNLFQGENCPPFLTCEFAHNDNWYVTFESEEDAQKAYRYLREEVGTFLGKPILARIKAKPLLRSSFVPKNGYKQPYEAGLYSEPQPQKFATQYQAVPTMANVPFMTASQALTTVAPAAFPFFPPAPAQPAQVTSAIPQGVWTSSPAPLPYFDPGTAFAVNGYIASGTSKPPPPTRSPHSFQNVRNNRNQKPNRNGAAPSRDQDNHNGNTDRSEKPSEHERPERETRDREPRDRPSGSQRDRPDRSMYHDRPLGRLGGPPSNHHHHHHMPPNSRDNRPHNHGNHSHNHPHPHSHSSHSHMDRDRDRLPPWDRDPDGGHGGPGSRHSSMSDGGKDQYSQPQPRRGGSYRGRRRPRMSDDSGANRSSSLTQSTKDKTSSEPANFDLEDTSFPPLPGSSNNTSSNEVFENKLSDVVKGTAKPSARDGPKLSASPSPPSSSPPVMPAPSTQGGTTTTASQPAQPPTPKELATSTATKSTSATSTYATATSNIATSTQSSSKEVPPTASLLPTPPQSPAKVSKVTSTESSSPAEAKASSTPKPATVNTSKSPTTPAPKPASKSPPSAKSPPSSTKTTPAAAAATPAAAAAAATPKPSPVPVNPESSSKQSSGAVSGAAPTSTATGSSPTGAATSSTAAPAPASAPAPSTGDEGKGGAKLSYAQMAQRGKEKVAQAPTEKPKDEAVPAKENPASPTTPSPKDSSNTATVSAASATANKSPTHEREDFKDARPPRKTNNGRPFERHYDRRDERPYDRQYDRRDRDDRRRNGPRDYDREGNRGEYNRGGYGYFRRGGRGDFDRIRGK